MAVTVKENVIPELILEDPINVVEESESPKTRRYPKRMSECPRPRPESPKTGEHATERTARELKNKLVIDKCTQDNEEN